MKRLLFVSVFCTLASAGRADDTAPADTAQAHPLPASAADYSYIRLGYTQETLSDETFGNVVFSGQALDLSWAYNNRWVLIGSHYSADPEHPLLGRFDNQMGIFLPLRKIPQEYTGIGALYHMSLGADTDLRLALEVGDLSFWHVGLFGGFSTRFSDNTSGTRVSVGLSSRFFDRLDAKLLLRQFQYKDSESFGLNELDDTLVEANYFFTEKYSIGLSFINNDYTDRFVANAGYSFD